MGEPWIRVHANLLAKPVVMRAAEHLKIRRSEAVGLLVTFWGQISQHVENGLVGHHTDAQLEAWAGWDRARGKFAAFVRAHHLDADGRVNEWDEYAGALEDRRKKDRDRKRTSRGQSNGHPADGHAETGVTSLPTRANETKRDETTDTSPTSWRPALESTLADRLPSDHARNALGVILHKAPNRLAWVAELSAMLENMAGHHPATGEQLDSAMTEFIADGHAAESPKLVLFKRYVERVAQRQPLPVVAITPADAGDALSQWARDTDAREHPTHATHRAMPHA